MATKNLGKIVPKMQEQEFSISVSYSKLELVPFEGSTYWSLVDDNIGHTPNTSPSYWVLAAKKGEDGGGYILPTASKDVLGGVKVGSNLTISEGVLSADGLVSEEQYTKDIETVYTEIDKKANNVLASKTNDGLMSSVDKDKLDGIEDNANNYELPIATDLVLGGVKVGENLAITNGVLSGDYKVATKLADGLMSKDSQSKLDDIESKANNYVLPNATESILGGVKVGKNLDVVDGVLSADYSNLETKEDATAKFRSLSTDISYLSSNKYNNPTIVTEYTDLNTFTSNGYFSFAEDVGVVNAPTAKGYLQNVDYNGVVVQYWYDTNNNLSMRSYNGSWSEWQELFTNLDLQAYFEKQPTVLEGTSVNIIDANTITYGSYCFSIYQSPKNYFINFPSSDCDGGLFVVTNSQVFLDYTNNKSFVRFKSDTGLVYTTWNEIVFKDYLNSYYLKTDTVDNAIHAINSDIWNVQEIVDSYIISDMLTIESGKVYHFRDITNMVNKPSDVTGECIVFKHDSYIYLYSYNNKCGYTYVTEWNKDYSDTFHPFADELTNNCNISLSGIVSGSAFFNGSKDISIATSLSVDKGDGDNIITSDGVNLYSTPKSSISVENAINATNDGNGDNIASTYARDDNTVHIDNTEKITGNKTFTNDINTNSSVNAKAVNFTVSSTPDENISKKFGFVDKNDAPIGGVSYNADTDDTRAVSLAVNSNSKELSVTLDSLNQFYPNVNNTITLGSYEKKWNNVFATTFTGNLKGNADTATSATKAVQDGNGNVITDTYATKNELSGKQNKLTTTQLNAVNSGITSTKVKTYDDYATEISAKADASDLVLTNTNLEEHTSNSVIHVTSTERSNWNAKSNFSGSYNDLTNKPTIPTVNNATLTIKKNGTTVNSFTANASSNVTANITVPTKTSDLTNDNGYITNTNDCVHLTGNESIDGTKTFTTGEVYTSIPRYAYNDEVTTNAYGGWYIRDKNESFLVGLYMGFRVGDNANDLRLTLKNKSGSNVGLKIRENGSVQSIISNKDLGASSNPWGNVYTNNIITQGLDPFRSVYGNYGIIFRNDGRGFYMLLTNKSDPYGNYNSYRPFTIDFATGKCYINGVDPSASSADVVGKTVTAYYTTANLSGRSDGDFSGNETRSFSTKTNTMTPTVGTIYSGAQLYATAVGSGSWSKSGNVSENSIYINQVLNSLLKFTGQYSSSAKYLCTTAQGVYNTSSGSSTLTNYQLTSNTGGGYTSTGTLTNGAITNTIGGGKSTFLRVQ